MYDDFAHHPTAIRTTVDGCAAASPRATACIRAIFEPRSNTMKLGAMKAQLPWALEEADLSFCHQGGLGWTPAGRSPLGATRWPMTWTRAGRQRREAPKPGDHLLCARAMAGSPASTTSSCRALATLNKSRRGARLIRDGLLAQSAQRYPSRALQRRRPPELSAMRARDLFSVAP